MIILIEDHAECTNIHKLKPEQVRNQLLIIAQENGLDLDEPDDLDELNEMVEIITNPTYVPVDVFLSSVGGDIGESAVMDGDSDELFDDPENDPDEDPDFRFIEEGMNGND
jgi:hypothetical protein